MIFAACDHRLLRDSYSSSSSSRRPALSPSLPRAAPLLRRGFIAEPPATTTTTLPGGGGVSGDRGGDSVGRLNFCDQGEEKGREEGKEIKNKMESEKLENIFVAAKW